ncbi:MAG: hypothetical protein R3F59_23645 [Myxococcota bacterium]
MTPSVPPPPRRRRAAGRPVAFAGGLVWQHWRFARYLAQGRAVPPLGPWLRREAAD